MLFDEALSRPRPSPEENAAHDEPTHGRTLTRFRTPWVGLARALGATAYCRPKPHILPPFVAVDGAPCSATARADPNDFGADLNPGPDSGPDSCPPLGNRDLLPRTWQIGNGYLAAQNVIFVGGHVLVCIISDDGPGFLAQPLGHGWNVRHRHPFPCCVWRLHGYANSGHFAVSRAGVVGTRASKMRCPPSSSGRDGGRVSRLRRLGALSSRDLAGRFLQAPVAGSLLVRSGAGIPHFKRIYPSQYFIIRKTVQSLVPIPVGAF